MFNLSKHKTSIKTEIMAGIITFLTMAYIIVVKKTLYPWGCRCSV